MSAHIHTRVFLAAAAALTLALALPAAARADEEPSPRGGIPGISQYVEDVPTAAGPRATARREGRETESRPLPQVTARRIARQGGDLAPLLTEVATSSRYGAPQVEAPPPARPVDGTDGTPQDAEGEPGAGADDVDADGDPSALSAGVSAASAGDPALGRLAALLFAVTVATLVLAAVRSRRGRA